MVGDDKDLEIRRNQRKAAKVARREQEMRNRFISRALSEPDGQAYFFWLLGITKLGSNPFTGNALTSAFNAGELNVGQQIQAHIIEVAPMAYFQMLEAREKERLNDYRTAADADDSGDDSDYT